MESPKLREPAISGNRFTKIICPTLWYLKLIGYSNSKSNSNSLFLLMQIILKSVLPFAIIAYTLTDNLMKQWAIA